MDRPTAESTWPESWRGGRPNSAKRGTSPKTKPRSSAVAGRTWMPRSPPKVPPPPATSYRPVYAQTYPAALHNSITVASVGHKAHPPKAYLWACLGVANFAECPFHALGWIGARKPSQGRRRFGKADRPSPDARFVTPVGAPPSAQRPIDSSNWPRGLPLPKTARNVTLEIFVFSDSRGGEG